MNISKKIPAIILAAGASSRMGRPKPLLELEGRSFADIAAGTLAAAGIKDIYMVLGCRAGEVSSALKSKKLKIIINSDWPKGQLSSLKAALRKLPLKTRGVLVCLSDHPRVSTETVIRILEGFSSGMGEVILPSCNGRRGHPVLFSRRVFGALLETPDDRGAREVVRSGRFSLGVVEVDDPFIFQDIDTPKEYGEMLKEFNEKTGD